jgi:hypothetical protein
LPQCLHLAKLRKGLSLNVRSDEGVTGRYAG